MGSGGGGGNGGYGGGGGYGGRGGGGGESRLHNYNETGIGGSDRLFKRDNPMRDDYEQKYIAKQNEERSNATDQLLNNPGKGVGLASRGQRRFVDPSKQQ